MSPEGGAPPAAPGAEPPLQFEMFSREWQQLSQQDNFDGFRIEAVTQVTKYLQAAHTLFLGTQLRECGYIYQFGPVFQSEGGRTVMVARAGLDGGVSGRIIQKFGTGFEVKASSQTNLKNQQQNIHDAAAEYTGKDWTCGAKLAWQGAWLAGGSFTQRLLPSLQLGGDLTCVAVNNLMTIWQLSARWTEGKNVFTAGLNRQPDPKSPVGANLHEIRLQYVRKLSDRLSLGTEFKLSHPDKDSGLSMGYEYAFRNARVQGLLETDGRVSCCVSDYQGLGFSGMIDYVQGNYKFGVLMHVMPPEQGQPPQ
uniref:Mitochondrial import receptor subunit TOM40 homolog n=1 Tax=Zooxanthella nutricula TaxID=1333877 RepID=A0A7S2LQI7_9DINO